jgi:dipeptidyl aminopeptidase/acylaminoacyl peptidase
MIPLRLAVLGAVLLAVVAGCKPRTAPPTPAGDSKTDPLAAASVPGQTLAAARAGFKTKLARETRSGAPVADPPPAVFRKVTYDAPVGKCAAYLTPDPKDGKTHPAIVWITGGDCNSIDPVWEPAERENDQTAHQYRDAGIAMMFPSLRGGNNNPGVQENFYGEVDDVLAAAAFLAKQGYVDPKRIYLGGHSTGGTLALLVAEVPNPFRAVFSFGPVHVVSNYPAQFRPAVNTRDDQEVRLRSPLFWLESIQNPTFVFEGTEDGNLAALDLMAKSPLNPRGRFPKVKFFAVKGATHFSVLAPANELIARKILADTGEATTLSFTEAELGRLFVAR